MRVETILPYLNFMFRCVFLIKQMQFSFCTVLGVRATQIIPVMSLHCGPIIFAHLHYCDTFTSSRRSGWEDAPSLQQRLQWSEAVLQLTRDGGQQGGARCAAACKVFLLHVVEQHKVPEDRS